MKPEQDKILPQPMNKVAHNWLYPKIITEVPAEQDKILTHPMNKVAHN